MNIIEHLNHSTLEYFDNILIAARRSNLAYDKIMKEEDESYTLELEHIPEFKTYIQPHNNAIKMEREMLYYQGYRDCICLLKFLSILPSENKPECSQA